MIRDATFEPAPAPTLDERTRILYTLLFAGSDTVAITMTGGLQYLTQHPELARELSDGARLDPFVEECVRLFNPIVAFGRRATIETEIGGQLVGPNEQIAIYFASANRDPAVFGHPDLELDRTTNRHIGFGAGVHRCLGSHLARRTMRIGFERLLARVEHFRLAGDPVVVTHQRRHFLTMPIGFDVVEAAGDASSAGRTGA
ncbi:MAG: cytochrome P450 [Actinomycetota bacterium]|nr:cytochrome P450 [Actinomycetota bacterium]